MITALWLLAAFLLARVVLYEFVTLAAAWWIPNVLLKTL